MKSNTTFIQINGCIEIDLMKGSKCKEGEGTLCFLSIGNNESPSSFLALAAFGFNILKYGGGLYDDMSALRWQFPSSVIDVYFTCLTTYPALILITNCGFV